jgi:SMI1 / KNR4 family (SUKH-1)
VTIESSFKELITLIEQETKAFSLPAGASDLQIAEAEQSIGIIFPDQLKALLRMHDGEFAFGSKEYKGLFCNYPFFSLQNIQDEYENVRYVHEFWSGEGEGMGDPYEYRALPVDSIRNTGVDLAWLPIGGYSGNCIGTLGEMTMPTFKLRRTCSRSCSWFETSMQSGAGTLRLVMTVGPACTTP